MLIYVAPVNGAPSGDWQTRAEATDYRKTARYDETVAYAKRLAEASPLVQVQTFGKSPEGRDMAVLVVSSDKAFTPEAARATGKEIILINAGIHAGEIPGKDAGLALIRDMVITGTKKALLDHAIVLFIPVFNLDGHERFGPYNRINQNGPDEMGWRTTAQNYNLNRDFLKADTPEMRAWLALFNRWSPDMVIDAHDTDGADYQYDLTYGLEMNQNLDSGLVAWQKQAFDQNIFPALTRQGHKVAPYIVLRDEKNLAKGFDDWVSAPRYSTGYGAIQNRPTLLIETHMLKDYKNRVVATYDTLAAILAQINQKPGSLRKAVTLADARTVERGRTYNATRLYPLEFKVADKSVPFQFLGVEYTTELSPISGSTWVQYDPTRPKTFTIPFYNTVEVQKSVAPPLAYVIPVAFSDVIERLKVHGVQYETLDAPRTLAVETYQFDEVSWQPAPFENHHLLKDLKMTRVQRKLTYPAGSAVVYLNQRAANVAIHLLEPDSADSLVRWGYFDAIFEPKEYAEAYVMEKMAREMLARDPKLKQEFEQKVASDPKFAASPVARLDFFYRRTPYYDERLNLYPVGRLLSPGSL